jgi:hypothetical protein
MVEKGMSTTDAVAMNLPIEYPLVNYFNDSTAFLISPICIYHKGMHSLEILRVHRTFL